MRIHRTTRVGLIRVAVLLAGLLGVLGASPSGAAAAQAGTQSGAQNVPQATAEVTPAQQDAFASVLKQAVRTGDATLLEPLLVTAGMSMEDVTWNQQSLPLALQGLGSDPAALRLSWGPPPAGGLGFAGQGMRFSASCTPATTLRVEVAGQPGNVTVLPLCLEDGLLKRVGTIRTPAP